MLTTVQVYPGSIIWDYAIEKGILPTIESQVEYIEAGCPKLNISGLDDVAFSDLCKRIGTLNQQRSVRIINPIVKNEVWNKGKLHADVYGMQIIIGPVLICWQKVEVQKTSSVQNAVKLTQTVCMIDTLISALRISLI